MVDKELIGIWKKMLKPSISSWLLKTNYEGMGEQDKEEFERDFDEILDLALIGLKYKAQLSQEGTTKDATSDTISRQAAISSVSRMMHDCFGSGDEEMDAIAVTLNELPSAQPEPRWIPCSERLPEEYGSYLITTYDGNVDIGTIDPNGKSVWSACDADGFYWMRNVIAWMPLPEPYRERREE